MAVFAAPLLLLATAACGGDSSDKNASALFAISAIDAAGMHEVDQDIQTGTIPATAESVAAHLQTAFLVTTWPTELKSPAAKAAALFGTMAGTLRTDKPDLAKVQAASAAAHAAWHQFSELAWTYLGTKAGVKNANAPTPSADHHH